MFQRILVCLDVSQLAEQILPFVEAQALCFGSKVALLQVYNESENKQQPVQGESREEDEGNSSLSASARNANFYLQRIAQQLEQKGIEVDYIALHGPVGETIIGYIQNEPVDLVALSTHGRSGLGRMLFGSVADYVMRESGLPVLIINPK